MLGVRVKWLSGPAVLPRSFHLLAQSALCPAAVAAIGGVICVSRVALSISVFQELVAVLTKCLASISGTVTCGQHLIPIVIEQVKYVKMPGTE